MRIQWVLLISISVHSSYLPDYLLNASHRPLIDQNVTKVIMHLDQRLIAAQSYSQSCFVCTCVYICAHRVVTNHASHGVVTSVIAPSAALGRRQNKCGNDYIEVPKAVHRRLINIQSQLFHPTLPSHAGPLDVWKARRSSLRLRIA